MRRFLAGAFVALLIFSACASKPTEQTSGAEEIRMMTYNIRNGRGMDDSLSVGRTASVINRLQPDVVAVQEIDSMTRRSGQTYVLGELASQTGMQAVYSPAIDYDGGKYGIGMLCREKPLSVRRIALPGREEARTFLVVEFEHYYYASSHLSLTEEDRLLSAGLIRQFAGNKDKPLFVAGDWNDTPDSPFLQAMKQDFTLLNRPDEATHPASNPEKTIDYIAVENSWADRVVCNRVEVVDAPVESDHRPVYAEITLK